MFKKIALTYVATMALIFGAVAVAPATADTPAGESNVSTVQLSGVLRSAAGQPVTNMKISASRFSAYPGGWVDGFENQTDEFGRFDFQLLAGETYGIWASRFSTGETEVIRDAFPVYFDVYFGMHEMTEDLALDLSLPGTKTIDFQIVDHTGEPVAGVGAETWFNCSLACQENGQYFYSGGWSLSDENGNVSLIIFEDSAELGSSTLTGARSDGSPFQFETSVSQTNSAQVVIPQMSKVSGVLRTASGIPVANADVVATYTSEGMSSQKTRTDDSGSYSLSMTTGETFRFSISGSDGGGSVPNQEPNRLPKHWNVSYRELTVTEDLTVDLYLPETKVQTLSLVDSKGNPITLTSLGVASYCSDSISEDPIYSYCYSGFRLNGDELDSGLSFATFNLPANTQGYVEGVDSEGLPVLLNLSTPRPYITGESQVGSLLSVVDEMENTESQSILSYQWLRNGTAISGATSPNYLLTRADNFYEISVKVTNSAAGLTSVGVSSPVQVNSLTYIAAPTISGSTNVGDVLQVTPGIWDQAVFAKRGYQWLRDGVPIEGAIGRTYVLQASDVAHRISVEERVSLLGFDSASAVSEQMPAVKAIPRKTMSRLVAPVLKGKSKVGSVLSSSVTSMGSGVVHSYQWFRDGVAIEGANERKYVLAAEDANASVTFQVCGSKLSYETACLESNSTVIALGELRRKPKVGLKWTSVKPGAVIESRSGTWDADVDLTYSWLRDGVEIANETGASYQLTEADRGHSIAFKVVAQKPGYNEVVRTSVAKLIP
jgi:5-hydroxyisourate hydrolase-like protein (transthyretin family)